MRKGSLIVEVRWSAARRWEAKMTASESKLAGFYSLGPASVELRIDYLNLRKLLQSRLVPPFPKIGGKYLIHEDDFDLIREAARKAGYLQAQAPSGSAA
jgi:hypothetical protein